MLEPRAQEGVQGVERECDSKNATALLREFVMGNAPRLMGQLLSFGEPLVEEKASTVKGWLAIIN